MFAAALAAASESETPEQRTTLKRLVTRLVGYPCKIACQREDGSMNWVEIYVMSERRGRVTDYLEIQPSGAVGVIFDLYDDPEKPVVGDLSDRCDAYNAREGLEFVEHDGGSDSDDEEDDEATGVRTDGEHDGGEESE
jgi:hypothetical protein